ncbi:MAG: cyclic nucleotide-binding domain-containing protein [Limnochordaceae bacterium]|nr:cyclic nucleotide-binding domain-containing protein [Limnochordaceae bacterium]
MARALEPRELPARERLFTQGIRADALYLVDSGLVQLIREESPGELRVAGLVGPGWVLAAGEVVDGLPYRTSCRSVGQALVWRLERRVVLELVERDPRLRLALALLVRSLSARGPGHAGLAPGRRRRPGA